MNEIKQEDEIFCPECGKPVKRNAVICISCGVQIKELKTSLKQEIIIDNPNTKSKTAAVVLAIFLGFWSWLYTYKKDFKKFWIFLSFMFVIVACVVILIIITTVLYEIPVSTYFITNSYLIIHKILTNYGTWFWLLYLLINASSYIWALINSIGRPDSFYTNYPNG